MNAKELKADANALMNLEMMDAIVGGTDSNACRPACTGDCETGCRQGCNNGGRNDNRDRKKRKNFKRK